jgi:Na+/proline symporter
MRRIELIVLVAVLLIVAAPAYAYIDPGAGSVMLQIVLGGLAGVAVTLRLLWRRITGRGAETSEPEPAPDPPGEDRGDGAQR